MKRSKKIIGLTGGIGTGKSTVTNILRKKGYKVVDADEISKNIYNKNTPVYKVIIEVFGENILDESGEINRQLLGSLVFNDNKKLKKLNDITHYHIIKKIKEDVDEILSKEDVVWVDIPLLIEEIELIKDVGLNFDHIVLIYASEEIQLKRIMLRDEISKEEGLRRIKTQIDIEEKKKNVEYIVENELDLEILESKVNELLLELNI